jgi:cell division protease FtsH
MSRIERIEKLKNAIEILKTEFVGLDKILDDLELSIRPWYVTPEIIDRPQIISLWGMTGTGKTSVVRRLVELLELGSKTLFFDCGDEGDSSRSITDKIEDYLGEDDDSGVSKSERIVFVFDELKENFIN